MIAGLPFTAWLLLVVAVGLPLALEIAFFRAHRTERRERRSAEAAQSRADAHGGGGP